MDKSAPRTVDAYIAAQPPALQPVLADIRAIILKALPGAEESITYQMPTYKLHGRPVMYFAGWKAHYALYPVTQTVVEAHAGDLAGLDTSKGTLRFPLSHMVPAKLVASIAKYRAREVADAVEAKKASRKAGKA